MQQLLDRKLKTAGFLLKQLPTDLDRFRALLISHPMTHAISRARSHHEVQPVARRMRIRAANNFNYVAVLKLGTERHHPAVDARAGAGVADLRVDHEGK